MSGSFAHHLVDKWTSHLCTADRRPPKVKLGNAVGYINWAPILSMKPLDIFHFVFHDQDLSLLSKFICTFLEQYFNIDMAIYKYLQNLIIMYTSRIPGYYEFKNHFTKFILVSIPILVWNLFISHKFQEILVNATYYQPLSSYLHTACISGAHISKVRGDRKFQNFATMESLDNSRQLGYIHSFH